MATAKKVVQAKEKATEESRKPKAVDIGQLLGDLMWERKHTDNELIELANKEFGDDVVSQKDVTKWRSYINKHCEGEYKGITKNPVVEIEEEGGTPPPDRKEAKPNLRGIKQNATPPAAEPHRMARKPRA